MQIQEEISNFSWIVVVALAVLGAVLLGISFKGLNSKKVDQEDSLGVAWSERFGIITLNGIFLLLAALIITLVKLAS